MYAKQPVAYLHVLPAIISACLGVLFTDINRATSQILQLSDAEFVLEMLPLFLGGLVAYFALLTVNMVNLRHLYWKDRDYQLLLRVRGPVSYFVFLMRVGMLSGFTAINCLLLVATAANLRMSKEDLTVWCLGLMLIIAAGHLVAERKQLGVQAWEL
jgi:hypothetical protein